MAMYTAVNLSFKLKETTPESVKSLLHLMFNDLEDSITPELYSEFAHIPFFKHENFKQTGWCTHYCFDDFKKSELVDNQLTLITSTGSISYGDLYQLFIDWLLPYIDVSESTLIGYLQYECSLSYYIWTIESGKLKEHLSSDLDPDFDPMYACYAWPMFPVESPLTEVKYGNVFH